MRNVSPGSSADNTSSSSLQYSVPSQVETIARAIDQHNSVILVLLDLSAAFVTVDHGILLSRLSNRFGITGTVLEWFRSYLSDRTQFVQVNGACSASHVLEFGVPQGSVSWPVVIFKVHIPSWRDCSLSSNVLLLLC